MSTERESVFTIGISGVGQFASRFIPLFQRHPLIKDVVLADVRRDRVAAAAVEFNVSRTFSSHEALCASDVDAIAIFTQRHLHGPMTLQSLRAGKHTYCAVPIASSLDDIAEIVRVVQETGLVYSNGETSYYYPEAIYCRERFAKGDFGEFVYGEGNYLHDMSHGFYDAYRRSGGKEWRQVAGFPPMYYPTHSTSMICSITGSRMTHVSCMGYADRTDDGVYGEGKNRWDNPFSSQTALMRTSNGGMARINEFRRVGWRGKFGGNPVCIYGTLACFEENSGGQFWTVRDELNVEDVGDLLHVEHTHSRDEAGSLHEVLLDDYNSAYAKVHPIDRLPVEYEGQGNGHRGSHQFLVDDFVKAVASNTLPPTHVWAAARYSVPGLVAHESSLSGGQLMDIPDFGEPTPDWEPLDPYVMQATRE